MDYKEIQAAFTKRAENCVLIGMADVGGVPTWGWGHTGPEVRIGQTITQDHADLDFIRDQAEADARLREHVPPEPFAKLDEHEKAALLDFAFNAGGGPKVGDKKEWNIWRQARVDNKVAIPDELNRFIKVHVNGQPVTSRGLKNRRTAEVVLWNTADVEAAVSTACAGGETVCSASTRTLPTPPMPDAPKALAKTSVGLKVAGVVSGAGAWVSQYLPGVNDKATAVHDLAAAHAGDNHYVAAVASVLSAVVVCVGVAMLFVHTEQQQAAKI